MRKYVVSALLLAGCGSSGGGSTAAPVNPGDGWSSYWVQALAELPTCDAAIRGRLYYVEESGAFSACKSSGWQLISVGINSNQLINSVSANLCTQFTSEVCNFTGGQLVKYSDNTVMLLGGFRFFSFASSGGDTDSDSESYSASVLIPSSVSTSYQVLSELVARGSGYRRLFLVYDRSGDTLTLVHDTNNNGVPNAGDELVATLTKASW